MTTPRQSSFEVRVPASTANMGAGFDCLGLALEMYLSVRATVLAKPEGRALARSRGVRGTSELPSDPDQNLIFRAMRHTAEREGFTLPRVRLAVQNEIPVAGGLGSSAAATVAGIALGFAVTGRADFEGRGAALCHGNGGPSRQRRRGAVRRIGGHVQPPRRHRRCCAQTLAESDSLDRGHAQLEARNKEIARGAVGQRSARRRRVQLAEVRALRRSARRPPLRAPLGRDAGPICINPRAKRSSRGWPKCSRCRACRACSASP